MIKGGGKSKGGGFEREVCKKLSLWVTEGQRDDIFWRSAMSGGRATVGFKKGNNRASQAGDISAVDSIGQKLIDMFVIECKFYRNIHLESMMFGKPRSGSIFEFWTKLAKESQKVRKDMMLVIKQNGWPILIGLAGHGNLRLTIDRDYGAEPLAIFSNVVPICCLYDFDKILEWVDPAVLEVL